MKILFVCKYNRFRSRVAEAYFKKICKNKEIIAESAGIIQGSYPLNKNQIIATRKLGINIKGKPRGLSTKLLKEIDFIVVAADNVPKQIFERYKKAGGKLIAWKIPDAKTGENIKENIKIIRMIMKKVDEFVKNLENKKNEKY